MLTQIITLKMKGRLVNNGELLDYETSSDEIQNSGLGDMDSEQLVSFAQNYLGNFITLESLKKVVTSITTVETTENII